MQAQKGKNIRRNLCRVPGTVVHSVINQSSNLCMLQPGSLDYGKWEFSFMHVSQILSVLLTDFANRLNQKKLLALTSFRYFFHYITFCLFSTPPHYMVLDPFKLVTTSLGQNAQISQSDWSCHVQESHQGRVVRVNENVPLCKTSWKMHLGIPLRSHNGHGE